MSFATSRAFGLGLELQCPQLDVATIVVREFEGSRTRTIERGTGVGRFVQLRQTHAEAAVRERKGRVEPQRLIERSRGLNPHIGVEIGESLIVEALRIGRVGGHSVVRHTYAPYAASPAAPAVLTARPG